MVKALYGNKPEIYISTLYISNFIQLKNYQKKQEKLIHDLIQETSYMKRKAKIEQLGVSMKINNENEKYTLHFIFHTKYLHIKSSRIPVIKKRIKRTYQLMRRKETKYRIIYQEKYI